MNNKIEKTARRRFIREIATGVSAATAAGMLRGHEATAAVIPQGAPEEASFKVVSPLGDSTVTMITMAPRLKTLSGKTIGMMWNAGFKANITLAVIADLLKQKYPDIKIIPYTEMPESHLAEAPGTPQTESMALQALFKEKGLDAIISGNGG
jgi:hypothetical protein